MKTHTAATTEYEEQPRRSRLWARKRETGQIPIAA